MKRTASPSTDAPAKKQRSRRSWAEFTSALEAVVGEYDTTNACTKTYATEVKAAVLSELSEEEKASAIKSWAEGNSITACGRKVGNDAVVRGLCNALLSPMTKIETSSTAQAKLWAAFSGPAELLAALGTDVDNPNPEGKARVKEAIFSCGKADPYYVGSKRMLGRIAEIHHVLLSDARHSLEHIREMTHADAKKYMTGFSGVGKKLASCVLSFTCDHPLLAVDTNVEKAVKKLGWVKSDASADQVDDDLNGAEGKPGLVPPTCDGHDNIRATLHGLLLNLGKQLGKSPAAAAFVAEWKEGRSPGSVDFLFY